MNDDWSSMTMLDDDDLSFLDDIREEAVQQEKTEERRELQAGSMRLFFMPKEADSDKKRRATLRFLVMLNKGAWVLEHGNYDEGWNLVCPAMFGFDCEYCQKICEVFTTETFKMTREVLLASAENLAKYGTSKKAKDALGFKSEKIRMWPVWYYEANSNKGDVYLFAYPVNKSSPILTIVERDDQYFFHPEEGYEPLPITEHDIKLVQTSKEKDRTFDAQSRGVPKPFAHQAEVDEYVKTRPFDRLSLQYAYAINKASWLKDDTWLKKLQESRKQLMAAREHETTPPKTPKTPKTPATSKESHEKVQTLKVPPPKETQELEHEPEEMTLSLE